MRHILLIAFFFMAWAEADDEACLKASIELETALHQKLALAFKLKSLEEEFQEYIEADFQEQVKGIFDEIHRNAAIKVGYARKRIKKKLTENASGILVHNSTYCKTCEFFLDTFSVGPFTAWWISSKIVHSKIPADDLQSPLS